MFTCRSSFLKKTKDRSLTKTMAMIACCMWSGASGEAWAIAEANVNQYLDMDLSQLMQVTITSVAKKPQALADAAAAVYVITQEDIRRSGVTSIPEALAMAPGLQVARISSSKWSVSSRGFGGYTSNKLLVVMDGRSIYSPSYSGTFWDMQHTVMEDIERIEVIRGPGATIWGANAVNGVINIITKKAENTQGGLIRVGAGNQEKLMGAARYGAKISDTAFGRFYISGNDRDSNVLAGSTEDAYDGWQDVQGGFRMDGIFRESSEWTLQADIYKNSGDQIVFPFWLDQPPYLTADYTELSSDGGNITGYWQQHFSSGDQLSLKAYYDYNNRDESYYGQKIRTADFELQYETLLGEINSLTMGAGYRHIEGDFTKSLQVYIPDQTTNLYSAFVQDEIACIADTLWVTGGIKYEYNDFTGSEWQPSVRLLWKPKEGHSFWSSVARAVRTPSMLENGGTVTAAVMPTPFGVQTFHIQGNEAYGSEELIAYEAGYRWQVTPDLYIDLAGYYNDYDDLYGTTAGSGLYSTEFLLANIYEGSGKGGEVAIKWQAAPWLVLDFTYSYLDLDLELKEERLVTIDAIQNVYGVNSPQHQASIRAALDFGEGWQLNLWGRWVDAIECLDATSFDTTIPVPSYFLFDSNVIWTPSDNVEFMLAVQNIFNSSQLQYSSELITPTTEIERGVYGKVTWHF